MDQTPQNQTPPGTQDALVLPKIRYTETSRVLDEGIGESVETTTFTNALDTPVEEITPLDQACYRAALAYPDCLRRMSLGMFGAKKAGSREESPALLLRPLGLVLMQFGGPHKKGEADYYFSVDGGFLASNHAPEGLVGKLYFRWWRQGKDEFFQTEVCEFMPMLVGKSANIAQRALYSATQMNMHRLVMWRYHVWVQKHRQMLLAQET